jgi:hypothetical protein
MTRLCIVARGELMLYGYLLVALEPEFEGPDRMEIVFDRRRPAPAPGGAPLDVERRTHPTVEEALRTQGYVILDENGERGHVGETSDLARGPRAAEVRDCWVGQRARSAWQARPATGTVLKFAGVLGALAISAVLVAAQFSTHADPWVADRWVLVPRGAESRMASAPAEIAIAASPPTVASPPALAGGPPQAGSVALVPSTLAAGVVASAPVDRPPAPGQPLTSRPPGAAPRKPTPHLSAPSRAAALRPAAAPVATPARGSAPTSAEPTVLLATDPQGKGDQRSITYTASVLDASGQPLTNAEVSLLAWMPDGTDLRASLGSTDTPGTYRVSVEVGVATPGNLRVRIAHGERSFDIVPQRRQR